MAQQQQPAGQAKATTATTPAAKPATPAADGKTKAERFKEIAPKRTRGILKAIEVLGNCSNRSGYEYSEADVAKIFAAIEKRTAEVKAKFSSGPKEKAVEFTL